MVCFCAIDSAAHDFLRLEDSEANSKAVVMQDSHSAKHIMPVTPPLEGEAWHGKGNEKQS